MNKYYFLIHVEPIVARTRHEAEEKLRQNLKKLIHIEVELDDIDTDIVLTDGTCERCGEYH